MAKKKKNIKNKGNDKKKMISNFPSKKEEKAVVDGVVEYEEGITVDELSQKIGQTPANVIKVLFMLGTMVTINSSLDDEQVELICMEYGLECKKVVPVSEVNFEDLEVVDDPKDLEPRPPVITIMGHVDHGKTTLLDHIRKSRVAEGEFGGITQHIGAYQVSVKGKKITFLDTPGHEAFTAMRARGAMITDIVIIVVAADDGVMPQTREAVDHALAANVPIIVAINKIDKPGADPQRIMTEVSELGLMPEEWGGDVPYVNISAKKGIGIDELLETVTVVAELAELKANPKRMAYGSVIEGRLDKGRGPVATLLIQNGTLRSGNPIVVGATYGRVRQLVDDRGREIKSAGPATPVEITGLNDVPEAGDKFMVFETEKEARHVGEERAQKKIEEAEALKKKVAESNGRINELSEEEKEVEEKLKKNMMIIPNIIDPSVPIGKDDSENVEVERFGEPVVPDFEVPYHTDIMESFNGIDLDAARRVAGNGFYYLMGDIARLHSAVISYARDFMINRGFTYCVPPFMIRSNVVTGVMSFAEMDAMMYKIEGEDLYLIGTSEHSMIGKFIGQTLEKDQVPQTLTSYSPCFRKEKGAHGIEERGVYRIHQFEKQEMIVVCEPEESKEWYDKLWKNTVDLFRSMDIPVRTLECCSGDLADLKVKSVDVEAWSPRQQKYFEVGSCSNLGDAQARRLGIRIKGENGSYFAHTLNNTVVAPPRMLIAFLENNLQADGSVRIPEVLQPYMGGNKEITPKNK